jgi:CheY-like chemotaxis protein
MTLGGGEGHILVVEDDPRSRRLLTELLEHSGYYVTALETGEKALQQLQRAHYELLVLDMQLPGMDGFKVSREIRKDTRLAALPILAVTSLSAPGDAARVLEAGADAYLSKPVDVAELVELVGTLLKDSQEVIGRYRVTGVLGEGAMKRVLRAHDSVLDRDVALSLILSAGLDDVGRERFLREAQAMARIGSHPNVVTVFDFGEHHEQLYIVTELVGGGDVERLLREAGGPLPLARVLDVAKATCRGLGVAHTHNVVHRDLKPSNVFLTEEGTAKIGDFGIAVPLDRTRLTLPGSVIGSPLYMAPEQCAGTEVTPQSDLYSFGAMLYEMVTGQPPFPSDDPFMVITLHLEAQPTPPSDVAACPPDLESLILRLLEKTPVDRPASATEVLRILEDIDSAVQSRGRPPQ